MGKFSIVSEWIVVLCFLHVLPTWLCMMMMMEGANLICETAGVFFFNFFSLPFCKRDLETSSPSNSMSRVTLPVVYMWTARSTWFEKIYQRFFLG